MENKPCTGTSPKPNISKEERAAIKSLKKDDNIIIPQADQRNATVLMNEGENTHKINNLVSDKAYTRLEKDQASTTERKLTKLRKEKKEKGNLTGSQYRKLNQHKSIYQTYTDYRGYTRTTYRSPRY